ncbi:hypothetical protein BGZ73_007436 [Actinomortierella ambigua]|nr:hypothetical protein BGZ73_007436 [Actinomortierella ambigua]
MSSTLARKRKIELKDLASSLGLSTEGTKDDLQERIKHHVHQHGTSDPSLQDLVREDSPEAASRRSSISETGSRRSSRRLTGLSSQDEGSSKSAKRSGKSKAGSDDSDSTEDPLSEHQVRNFMEKMQGDVQEAKHLAHELEETLQNKFQAGKEAIRRASKDFSETVTHALQHRRASQSSGSGGSRRGSREEASASGSGDRHKHHKKHHHRRHSHRDDEEGEGGFLAQTWSALKRRCANCTAECCVATHLTRCWKHTLEKEETLFECLSFLTNWNDFLRPFFVYYVTLFLLPTLLSQIFNVDRAARHHHKHEDAKEDHHHRPTGLFAKRTTSGLSFFVFKFALTYLLIHHHYNTGLSVLSPTALGNVAANGGAGWAKVAKDAADALGGSGHGHHHHHHHHYLHHLPHLSLKHACECLDEVFRYVPATFSLVTSGVGTVLALAETIVSRR